MISSELPEVIGLSDRVLVMRMGTIAGEAMARPLPKKTLFASPWGWNARRSSPRETY